MRSLLLGKAPPPMCSFVAQNCPWSVRSPQREFLRERGKLKIVALGRRAHSLCLGPWPALSLWSQIGLNDGILKQLWSPSLEPRNSPFLSLGHPVTKRSDQLEGSSDPSGSRVESWEIPGVPCSPRSKGVHCCISPPTPSPFPLLCKLQV